MSLYWIPRQPDISANAMSYEDYTWERYYEDIYHRQKKLNNTLAVQLGEITAKTDEMNIALNRVIGSSLWKALSPARKIYNRLRGNGSPEPASTKGVTTPGSDSSPARREPLSPSDVLYARRLWDYEDYYAQWIRKDPIEQKYLKHSESGMSRVREAHFHTVFIEDCAGTHPPFDASIRAKWILFTRKNCRLALGYAERLETYLDRHPDAKIAYADEDYFYSTSEGIHRIEPNFKPDWSPDTLDSFFYFGNIALIRADVAIRLDWHASSDPYVNVYDLFLQASDRIGKRADDPAVVHIPQILCHNPADSYKPSSYSNNDSYELWSKVTSGLKDDLGAGRLTWGATARFDEVKRRSFKRRGIKADFISGQFPGERHIRYALPASHKVSVLILTKDHPNVLKKLLSSFIERTDYDDLEFIIVDNGSDPGHRSEYTELIDEVLGEYRHEYIYEPQDFNFSKLCNRAASAASGDSLLFMNDDIEIVQKDWLGLMAGYAFLPHVGAVGAKLLYADSDLIQHVGVTSMEIGPSHKLVIYPDDREYYYGKNSLELDQLGVTAACLLIQTSKFDGSHGFDESFPVAYNDVEFCMRLTKSGLVNLQCNGALLYHHESMTRGQDEGDDSKWERLLNEKSRLYKIHPEFLNSDPYYNPNLIGNHSNYLSNFDYGFNNHSKCESVRQIDASELAECSVGNHKISVEIAGIQPKIRLEEPEIIEVRGWTFESGCDNSLHIVSIILKNETTDTIYRVKSYPVPRPDLETTFPGEKNNRLCGFDTRMLKSDLPAGTYRVGLEPMTLNDDLTTSESSETVIFTEERFTI
ncbi:Glycosyltransferase, GT2 family [Lachnospiraceae bacterium XBB2008]|nr:Glycosyltransferase, GT2 family [Lachnospiraceae bacterium XBB2008]